MRSPASDIVICSRRRHGPGASRGSAAVPFVNATVIGVRSYGLVSGKAFASGQVDDATFARANHKVIAVASFAIPRLAGYTMRGMDTPTLERIEVRNRGPVSTGRRGKPVTGNMDATLVAIEYSVCAATAPTARLSTWGGAS